MYVKRQKQICFKSDKLIVKKVALKHWRPFSHPSTFTQKGGIPVHVDIFAMARPMRKIFYNLMNKA